MLAGFPVKGENVVQLSTLCFIVTYKQPVRRETECWLEIIMVGFSQNDNLVHYDTSLVVILQLRSVNTCYELYPYSCMPIGKLTLSFNA